MPPAPIPDFSKKVYNREPTEEDKRKMEENRKQTEADDTYWESDIGGRTTITDLLQKFYIVSSVYYMQVYSHRIL